MPTDSDSKTSNSYGAYIRRGKQTNNFTAFPNSLLQNPELTHRQTGIMVNILSRPPDWKCRVRQLSDGVKEGRDAVRTALKGLRTLRYVSLVHERQPDGTIHTVYYVFSDPIENDQQDVQETESPEPENPSPVRPSPVEPATACQTPYKRVNNKKEIGKGKIEKSTTAAEPNEPTFSSQRFHLNPDVVALLRKEGMDEIVARGLAAAYSRERINEAIDTMKWKRAKGKCDSPAGFIHDMLVGEWTVPKAVEDAKRKRSIAEGNELQRREERLRVQAEQDHLTQTEQRAERVVSGMNPTTRSSYCQRAIESFQKQRNGPMLQLIQKREADPTTLRSVRMEMARLWNIDNGRVPPA